MTIWLQKYTTVRQGPAGGTFPNAPPGVWCRRPQDNPEKPVAAWNDFADQYGTDDALARLDTAQIEAVVDLLLLVMYADDKASVLEEMEFEDQLCKLPAIADKRAVIHARRGAAVARVKGADAGVIEAIAGEVAAALTDAGARKAAFARRKAAHGAGRDPDAVAALLRAIGPVSGAVIAGYMPIRTEVDPLPAMGELSKTNRICVPVIEAAGLPLKFREWRPGCAMASCGPSISRSLLRCSATWQSVCIPTKLPNRIVGSSLKSRLAAIWKARGR